MFGFIKRDPFKKFSKPQTCLLRTKSRVVPGGVAEVKLLHFSDGVEKLMIKTDPGSMKSFITSDIMEKVFKDEDGEYVVKTGASEYCFRVL